MSRLSRRGFLSMAGAGALAWGYMPGAGAEDEIHAAVSPRDGMRYTVPDNFIGLSYESSQLMDPGFFSPGHQELIELFGLLGRKGVLRLGGNSSAFTRWGGAEPAPNGGGESPVRAPAQESGVETPGPYRIEPQAIRNLCGFLQATGWELIYGLNLQHGTPGGAAEEAAFVVEACGGRLLALQFGNEPDLFRNSDGGENGRRTLWSFEQYMAAWERMYAAVRTRLPRVAIAGPDTASRKDWVRRFAARARGRVELLTSHYYAEGPPEDPRMTLEFLLQPGTRLQDEVYAELESAQGIGVPYRMSEGNSCYNGGKPGVSDTLGAALWVADLLLDLQARGASGVNLHGGGAGPYTPIAIDHAGRASARAVFFGMELAGMFAGSATVPVLLQAAAGVNATAYAAREGSGSLLLAIINKSSTPLRVDASRVASQRALELLRLAGLSLESRTGISFGAPPGSENAKSGPLKRERSDPSAIRVPAWSAVLARQGR